MRTISNRIIIGLVMCISLIQTAGAQVHYQKLFSNLTEYQQLANSTSDNSNVIASSIGNEDGLDFSAIKIDAQGKILWSKTFNSPGEDYLSSIAIAATGDIYLGGYKLNKDGHFDFSLMRLNASGNLKWYKTFETSASDISVHVGVTSSGAVFLSGNIDSDTKKHIWILKINDSGDILWSKMYGSSASNGNVNILAAAVTKDDGLAVLGINGTRNYFMKMNTDGTIAFTKQHDLVSEFEDASSLKQVQDGFIFCGKIKDCTDELCTYIFAFMKLDQNGNVSWSKNVSRSKSQGVQYIGKGKKAIETADGGFAFIGQLTDSVTSKLAVIKTNATGTILWTKAYGHADSYGEYAGIESTSDGGLLFLGTESSNAFLIKTDANGTTNCDMQALTPQFGNESIPKSVNMNFTELKDVNVNTLVDCKESELKTKDSLLCEKILDISGVDDVTEFKVYPNPFEGSLMLDVINEERLNGRLEFNLYDVLGKIVRTQALSNSNHTITIPRDGIPNGLYFYEIRDKDKILDHGKVIAQ